MLFPFAWLIHNPLTVIAVLAIDGSVIWLGQGNLIGICFYGSLAYIGLWGWASRYLKERRIRKGLRPPKPQKQKPVKKVKPKPLPVVRRAVPPRAAQASKDYVEMLLTLPKGLRPFIEQGLNEAANRVDAESHANPGLQRAELVADTHPKPGRLRT